MSKDNYEDLNLRQKSLVDAIALKKLEDRDLTAEEVTELAHELSDEKKYAESSYYNFLDKYEDIIDQRKQMIVNDREEEDNEVITVGDPLRNYKGPKGGIDATMQHISERPKKDSKKWEVSLSQEQVFDIIREADKDTAWEIFQELVE